MLLKIDNHTLSCYEYKRSWVHEERVGPSGDSSVNGQYHLLIERWCQSLLRQSPLLIDAYFAYFEVYGSHKIVYTSNLVPRTLTISGHAITPSECSVAGEGPLGTHPQDSYWYQLLYITRWWAAGVSSSIEGLCNSEYQSGEEPHQVRMTPSLSLFVTLLTKHNIN